MERSALADPDAAGYRNEFNSVREIFDARPKLVVGHHQEVLWCCEHAPRILKRPMPLILRDGKLSVADDELRGDLIEFLNHVGPHVERKLIRAKAQPHWLVLRAWKPAVSERAVCIVCSPSLPVRGVDESGLAMALKLTKAESRVLQEFAELRSPKEIARSLGLSVSTVRSHLKAIHAKALVTTSLQLLRLVHSFCSA
jgi:DNA-binding CsgD family transcriptional regulator